MSEFQFSCEKCPRTFKLQEFYEKHKKVHDLKKQHRCHICGFVYGAAKGLEGHLKSHEEEDEKEGQTKASEPPYNMDFHFLNPRGVLAEAHIPPAATTSSFVKSEDSSESPSKNGKLASPSGTGSYEIFDSVPDVSDATAAVQNDSGFFMCTICSREFSGLNSLKKHIPIHTRRIQHRCDVCGHVFGKKEYLLDHMRKHTGEVSPVCEVCGQTFNKSLKLKEHFKLHRNTNTANAHTHPYHCHVCRAVFNRAAILGNHLATAHAETVYKCDICEATFGDVRGKNHHMYNEHQLDAFHQKCVWCPVCNQGFTRHYNLKVHMYKSHGKEYIENNFSAAELAALTKPPPGGSSGGTSKSRLESPPKASPPNSLLKSVLSPGIGKHYFDAKNGTAMFSCQMCNEKFIRKSDLYIHLDTDHGVILLGCTSCDDKFLDMLELQNHVQLNHPRKIINGRRPGPASRTNAPRENRMVASDKSEGATLSSLNCKDCLKSFNDKTTYFAHMRMIHGKFIEAPGLEEEEEESEDEESVDANNPLAIIIKNLTEAAARKAAKNSNVSESCNFCEKVFNSQTDLRDHIINIHIKGFYFNCELCGKSFPQQNNLDSHMKAKHPNIGKRAQHLRNALGLEPDQQGSPAKRARLEGQLNEGTTYSKPGPLSSKQNKRAHQAVEPEPEEDIRYEAITESFIFEGQIIDPCYVVLPFSTQEEVDKACNPHKNGFHAMVEDSLDDDVPLTIDESVEDPEEEEDEEEETPIAAPSPLKQKFNYNAEDLNLDMNPSQGFYPALPDFSLPFTMANLWKKKADVLGPVATMQQVELMEKIERMQKYNGSPVAPSSPPQMPALPLIPLPPTGANNNKKSSNSPADSPKTNGSAKKPKAKSMSPQKPTSGDDNATVSAYENQIQEDIWPLDCIKCNMLLGNLDNFNLHMNDHWSEDKCCPVCGLLINSKRFNFKQHLKIHTGEKPFVCAICNRSFRQKAHMVKHVTTHRGVPNISEVHAAAIAAK